MASAFTRQIERLRRESTWDVDEAMGEVYSVFKAIKESGFDFPLILNPQGAEPGIIFRPADIDAGGSPFQLQTGGTYFNYTFGGQTGTGSVFEFAGGNDTYGGPTVQGNAYNFYGSQGGAYTQTFDPGDFGVDLGDTFWGGAGPGGGGAGGGGGVSWPPLAGTIPEGGTASAFGTSAAVGTVLSGSGTQYRIQVKGFGNSTFETDATALGLAADDKLAAGCPVTVVAYVTGPDTADVFFTPAVYSRGS